MVDEKELVRLQKINNPHNEPIGHYTGRCAKCGSKDLWEDAFVYGCNCCGARFATGGMLPQLVCNFCRAQFPISETHHCPVAKKDIFFEKMETRFPR